MEWRNSVLPSESCRRMFNAYGDIKDVNKSALSGHLGLGAWDFGWCIKGGCIVLELVFDIVSNDFISLFGVGFLIIFLAELHCNSARDI